MTNESGLDKGANTGERILLIEDDQGLQRQMRWALSPHRVMVASSRQQAVRQFKSESDIHIVILDLGLPPDSDGATEGLKTLSELLALAPQTKVIVVSGNTDHKNALGAVAKGAFEFIAKPIDIEVLKIIIERANRMYALEEENRALREAESTRRPGFIFRSSQMANVHRLIERVGPSDVSVLIVGETGTGKEVVARSLHEASARSGQKFAAINCASIPEALLESELFGHEKGAFTGAVKQTLGKVEVANNGTLFLDEIADMPVALQAKVLRFLQDWQFERVGGRTTITVNVRVISATNRPLEKMMRDESFREDLFYRLNGVRIDLPPLREREGDELLLVHHFLNVYSRQHDRRFRGFSEDAIRAIADYHWPGNIRELENRVRRAVIMAEGTLITASDLELSETVRSERNLNLRAETEKLERMLIAEALAASQGNISRAAKELGVSRPHLYHLMKQFQLP
jgi:two-component system NtrC family response regulator